MQHKLLFAMLMATAVLECGAGELDSKIHTDRYTLHSTSPRADQAAPMKAIINVSMGKHIVTVGDAVREVLKGSGYRWHNQTDGDKLLNALPLPSVVRELGPIALSDALSTIAGEAWQLQTDHLNRVIWFTMVRSPVPTPYSAN